MSVRHCQQNTDSLKFIIPSADSFLEVDELPVLGTGKLDLKGLKTKAEEHFGD